MMYILIDIGNTRMKVSVADGHGIRPTEDWRRYLDEAEAVLVSNVAGEKSLPEDVALLPKCRVLTWQTAEARRWIGNIPEGLGADRLAADIGARSLCPGRTILVIDAGTCLTFDVIGADGSILGGSISPGMAMRLKAMHEHTAALPLVSVDGDHPVLGYDTPTAMRGGAVNGMRWEMEGYIRHVLREYPDLHVFVTGGDRTGFAEDLQSMVTYDPLLVQRGLLAVWGD